MGARWWMLNDKSYAGLGRWAFNKAAEMHFSATVTLVTLCCLFSRLFLKGTRRSASVSRGATALERVYGYRQS